MCIWYSAITMQSINPSRISRAIKERSTTCFLPFSSDVEGTGASEVQFIFAAAVSSGENCTFNQDFYQFASADGAKTKPIVAVTGRSFKCSNATVRVWCARIYWVYQERRLTWRTWWSLLNNLSFGQISSE